MKRREQTPEEWIEAVLAAKEKEAPAATFKTEKEPDAPVTAAEEIRTVTEPWKRRETDDCHDVVLLDAGERRDEVIRTIMGSVYDKSSDQIRLLVESVPSVLMEKVPRSQAERLKASLEEVGAQVDIR